MTTATPTTVRAAFYRAKEGNPDLEYADFVADMPAENAPPPCSGILYVEKEGITDLGETPISEMKASRDDKQPF